MGFFNRIILVNWSQWRISRCTVSQFWLNVAIKHFARSDGTDHLWSNSY